MSMHPIVLFREPCIILVLPSMNGKKGGRSICQLDNNVQSLKKQLWRQKVFFYGRDDTGEQHHLILWTN